MVRTITVEVCVCTQCVLHGAMNIIESVESMRRLKYEMRHKTRVELSTISARHPEAPPLVKINGEAMENATCQQVMESIVSYVSKSAK
ncbi:MAG TPA: hypothetical protein IAB57_08260 [Candidatus Fimivivens faecavium]|nr:hypothetical protein [Candidatus Fimivivens faecavium]